MRTEAVQVDWAVMLDARPPEKPLEGKLVAYCNSISCYPKGQNTTTTHYGAVKNVSNHADYCPNCTSALFWVRERKTGSRNRVLVAKKSSRYVID